MTTLTETNSIHRSPLLRGLLVMPLLLACLALLPRVQAAPDPAAIPGGNTRDGAGSLASRTTGTNNSAFGTNALNKLTMGNNNAAQGNSAQFSLIEGNKNTGLGVLALRLNVHGDNNTAVGYKALYSNTANANVAVGTQALYSNTGGVRNTATGFQALFSNTVNGDNTAVGFQALSSNSTGGLNTAVGQSALANTSGSGNIALGANAGLSVAAGINNIVIGNIGAGGDSSTIRIGSGQTKTFIAGIRGVTTGNANALTVVIDSAGQLGTMSSSRRFKKEIKSMDQTSEAILGLKPVTFHYKSDSTGTPQFGLIAEEVAEVNPDLVVRDDKGEIYTVRYEAVNAMLLNEFLKEYRKVQELEKQVEKLTAGLQKVGDQLELSKPAPQMVGNNR